MYTYYTYIQIDIQIDIHICIYKYAVLALNTFKSI